MSPTSSRPPIKRHWHSTLTHWRKAQRKKPRGLIVGSPTPVIPRRRIAARSLEKFPLATAAIPMPPLPICGWAWRSNRPLTSAMIFSSGRSLTSFGRRPTPLVIFLFPMLLPVRTIRCLPLVLARRARSCRKLSPVAIRRYSTICRHHLSASQSAVARQRIWARLRGFRHAWGQRFLRLVIPTGRRRNSGTVTTIGSATSGQAHLRPVPSGVNGWNTPSIFRMA